MAKVKTSYQLSSFGIYSQWEERNKDLPKIKQFTTDIPLQENIEFGFTLHCLKAKGKKLNYIIFHPDIKDDHGHVMPPFTGDVYVGNNDWYFYLGDCIWPPINNKQGDWRMVIALDGVILAQKTFNVLAEHGQGEVQFWKRRGY